VRADSQQRLSLVGLAIFSSPMVVIQAIEVAWRVYLPSFFATSSGLSLAMAGALLMAARLFDSIIDPAIAWASDRFPTRYGHRRPWLAASVPLMMTGALGVYFIWPWTTLPLLVAASLLLHLGYMMLVTPHGGWALEQARDGRERLRVIGAKTWFGVAGMIAIVTLPALLERGFAVDRQGQVAALGLFLLVACPLSVGLILRFVAEPDGPRSRAGDLANPFRLFGNILRMPALRPILLLYLFTGFAESAASATFLFFIDDALALRGWGSSLLLLQSAAVLVTLPIWSRVADRIGFRPMLAMAYGWQFLVMPFALFLPAGALGPAIAFLIVRSLFSGVDFLLLRALVAEIVHDTASSGLRQGASCYSISNITLKIAMGGGTWCALSLIGWKDGSEPLVTATLVRAAFALPAALASGCAFVILLAMMRRRETNASSSPEVVIGSPQRAAAQSS